MDLNSSTSTESKLVVVKQEMLPVSWSKEFHEAFINFTIKVRKGEVEAPDIKFDYGMDGSNPDGVGASSLNREVRQWWYGRKKNKQASTPPDYKFTQEQGRLMEQPVIIALQEMGVVFEGGQVQAKTDNYGGFVDGLGMYNSDKILFESKHVGASRYLELWYSPLNKADEGYFWQAEAYLNGCDAAYSLFVISAQDASSVRKMLTDDLRFTKKGNQYRYDHDNPPPPKAFAFRLYKSAELHEPMDKRAKAMLATVNSDVPPAREYDIHKDWHCNANFCGYRDKCLTQGKDGDTIYQLPEVKVEQVYLKEG